MKWTIDNERVAAEWQPLPGHLDGSAATRSLIGTMPMAWKVQAVDRRGQRRWYRVHVHETGWSARYFIRRTGFTGSQNALL